MHAARRSSRSLALPLVALVALLGAGCTQDVDDGAGPPPTVAEGTPAAKVTMTSAENVLYELGPDDEQTYGWNRLVGPAEVLGALAEVEILGNVEYVDGSGPFYGFLTVKWKDGATLGFNLQGRATKDADGTTALAADLRLLGGTGRYAEARAAGEFTGSRTAEVGSPITVELRIDVAD